jgi:uncharacterized protein (DUF302 family)
MTTGTYAVATDVALPFDDALAAARAALADEGFGVLCEIDVQATMRAKLGVEREPYTILGACNPGFARQAIEAEHDLGVLLPCNVVVSVVDGTTRVSAVAADAMLAMVGNDALTPIAAEVAARLGRVVERLAAA